MIQLLKQAFRSPKHRVLIIFALLSMCLVTIASQLEIFSLGVITNKGMGIHTGDPEHPDRITQAMDYMDRVFPISNNVKNLAIMLVVIAFFKAITLFTHRYLTKVAAIGISRDLRQRYFEHIQSLPMEFYKKYNIGSLSARVVGDTTTIAEAINSALVNYFQTPFTILTTLTLCFLTSWQLTLIIFLGFPAIIFPIVFLAGKVRKVARQLQKNQEVFSSVLIDFLAGIETVKVFAMEDFSLKKYREHNHQMARLERKGARYDLSTRPIVHTIGMFFLAAALLCGLYMLEMSISEVLFFGGMLHVFYEPVKKFAEENSHIQKGIAAAERMQEILKISPQIEDAKDAIELKEFEDEITFDHVWFRYEGEWILRDLSFTVKKGQTVAIVGPTGAGKSTIVHLLPRLYEVQKGKITIDGKPLQAYTQRSIREIIAFVPQKPFLFYDTIYENIAFGRPFGQQSVSAAARLARAEEFICRLPEGYHTQLSEMGKSLSGGQQQRIAIARALVKEAPILVLDEATSSLDNVSETHIQEAISSLKGKVTQIIIAHRLTTIEDADKIIYLDEGQKIAEGTKDELLQTCPQFKQMWERKQSKSLVA